MTKFFRKSAEGFPVEPDELLAYARNVCESLGLVYLVTGSTATIAYGEPRFTNDIAILVESLVTQILTDPVQLAVAN